MLPLIVAVASEVGLMPLAAIGAGVLNLAASQKRRRKPARCIPMEDGRFFAGRVLTARELRKPRERRYRAFLKKNARDLELTAKQRKQIGI